MNNQKLFGICIVFLLAATIANAAANDTYLDQLLNNYGSSYDDGDLTANYQGTSFIIPWSLGGTGAGGNKVNFTIGGPSSGSPYTAIASIDIFDDFDGFMAQRDFIVNKTTSGNTLSLLLDGTYYYCGNSYSEKTFYINLRLYQGGVLKHQGKYIESINCHTEPAYATGPPFPTIVAKNIAGDSRFDTVNYTMDISFPDARTYKVGAYIWDNKSSYAYSEKTVTASYSGEVLTIPFNYSSELLRGFELNNERIFGKSLMIDGHVAPSFTDGSASTYLTSDFSTNEIMLTNYAFNKILDTNGKVKQLDAVLTASGVTGTYNVELSLENKFGEVIEVKNTTITGPSTIVSFNGTDIYNSKINGPYRLGFVRITKSGNELLYKLDKGMSQSFSYANFTFPSMPDLDVRDQDVQISAGTNINITIYNRGAGDAAGITVSLFDNSANKVKEVILDELANGANTQYTFINTGLTNAFIAVDFTNGVEETNESNNIASNSISVSGNPLIISGVGSSSITNQSAVISWTTNLSSNTSVKYWRTGFAKLTSNTNTPTISHSRTLSGLRNNTLYNYNVTSCSGVNCKSSGPLTFTTLQNSAAPNNNPVITTNPSGTASRGLQYSYDMNATDADVGDTLTYSTNSTFGSINPSNGLFTWSPSDNDYETRSITFSVTDGKFTKNQSVTISLTDDSFILKASTLDFNQRELNNYNYINSNISINSQNGISVGITPATFNISSNVQHTITHSSGTFQSDSDNVYFDSKLSSMINGQTTTLTTAGYTTICTYQTTNWYCSVEGNGMKKTWFRYKRGTQEITRVNYLLK